MSRWALVTGASAGIGLATATKLAVLNYNLIITGRRAERLELLKAKLEKTHSIQVQLGVFDISDSQEVLSFFQKNPELTAKLDVLINNAGLARGIDPLQEGRLEDWDEMIDTNIKGLLSVTRQVLPAMIKKNSGHIVNLGSVAGRWTYPNGAVYSATKFAVRALSEGLRMDLLGKNIRVTNIEPGMVETEFSQVRLRDEQKAKAVYQGMKPLSAEDIAETIIWALERPAHVNIQELVIYPTAQASVQMVHRQKEF